MLGAGGLLAFGCVGRRGGTYVDETGGDDDAGAELFDDGEDDAGAIHFEHLLQDQGSVHSCLLSVLLFNPTTSLNSYQVRLRTTSGR